MPNPDRAQLALLAAQPTVNDGGPVLTLRERTPAEREAWWQGARHMHASLLSRLPGAAMVPAEGSFRAEDIAAVFREVGAMFAAVRDLHGEPSALLTPQPLPLPTEGDVWAEVIADTIPDDPLLPLFVARREFGFAKYKQHLGRGNGRDFRADAMQEAMDGIAYCRGAGDRRSEWFFRLAAESLLTATMNEPGADRSSAVHCERADG